MMFSNDKEKLGVALSDTFEDLCGSVIGTEFGANIDEQEAYRSYVHDTRKYSEERFVVMANNVNGSDGELDDVRLTQVELAFDKMEDVIQDHADDYFTVFDSIDLD